MVVLHLTVRFIYVCLLTRYIRALGCADMPIGMENHAISVDKITASSGTAGDQARLNHTNGPSWCAMANDNNPYLQIDLGTPHIICAVATQGDHHTNSWVKTFRLSSSDDGVNYEHFGEPNGFNKTFYGNLDASGIVKQILYKGIFARYLRILPKMYHGANCIRAEVYGIKIQTDNLALKKEATQSSNFASEPNKGLPSNAVDGNRDGTWLGGSCTHCGKLRYYAPEWWQVDLGSGITVAEVSVFTRSHPKWGLRLWNSSLFELRIGFSEKVASSFQNQNGKCGGQYGIIPAGSITIVCTPPMPGKYVVIKQMVPYRYLSLCEVEVYGKALVPVCVRNPVVLASSALNASSYFPTYRWRYAAEARLFGNSSWRPRDDDSNPWLQIDLGEIYYVCAVATQGDPDSDDRTQTYKLKWTLDGVTWKFVENKTSKENMVFTGNRDRSSIIKHILPSPLTAKLIRFYPVDKNTAHALRVEIYGVKKEKALPKPSQLGDKVLQPKQGSYVDLMCRADGGLRIKWYYNDTDITGYSNGTVRSGAMLISNLRINYTSADDVYEKYSCGEVDDQKRNCTSLEYICQVDYGSYRKLQTSGKVIVLGLVSKINKVSSVPTKTTTATSTATIKNKRERVSNTQDNTSSMVIAIAVVFSLLTVIAIAMVIFILWYKRRRRSPKSAVKVHATFRDNEADDKRVEDTECRIISNGEGNQDIDQEDKNLIPVPLYNVPSNEIKEKKSGAISVDEFSGYMSCVRQNKYEELMQEFQILDEGKQFPSTVAKRPVNKMKNRYGNIVPYDTSRVVLEKLNEDEDSDYMNASYIRGFNRKNISYIASQGPLKQTIDDFWRMIWLERTSVIVMLTGLIEGKKTKCEKYWPDNNETYHDLTVKLQKTEVFADYSIRTFFVSKINTAEQRYVFQYHFTSWPDKGVPQHATQLLAFRKRLVSDTTMGSPWVVHCSAGVGRTGAFLAIDAMLRQAQEKKTIDIFNYVKAMRKNRPNMVQTAEQYIFIHMAILEYLTCGVTEVQAQQLREKMKRLAQIDEKDNLSGYEMEFKHLSHVCTPVQDDEIIAGNKPCNSKKNRFQHIVPLDKARVILQVDVEEEGANYINASYANGYRQKDAYILTQAPLDNTIADFWRMIYERRLGTVVVLNNLREGEMSFPKYWPEEGSLQYEDIAVEIMQEEEKNPITLRTLALTHKSDGAKRAHEVRHYQHTEWSHGSAPNNERTVLDLIEKLQRSQQQSGNKSVVVQCSDGVGRSGTLCAILSLLDRVKTEQMVDVFQTVKTLRISRPGAVETAAQYEYCFHLVMSYLDSFSDYSNFNG